MVLKKSVCSGEVLFDLFSCHLEITVSEIFPPRPSWPYLQRSLSKKGSALSTGLKQFMIKPWSISKPRACCRTKWFFVPLQESSDALLFFFFW